MKKDNVMSAVLGLVVGLVIGFMFANNVNRGVAEKPVTQTLPAASTPPGNQKLPPDHPPIGTSGGDSETQAAPLPQVMEAIEKAKAQPQNYEAQMTAADLYYQIQRFDEAAQIYEVAIKLRPGENEPVIKAGNAYFDAEKYELAEKWYLLALQKEPKNINVRTDLGLTFFSRSPPDVDRAIKEYKISLDIDPNYEITLQNLALAYGEKGDQENFRTTLEKLKKVNPNNPVVTKSEQQ